MFGDMSDSAKPTLIFVHGACVRDADWWWRRMVGPLGERGIATAAVPLPSCGEAGPELGDLHADAAACRTAIDAADGPVALLGHSYGGMVITEAGADERVARLLYLTAMMPDEGESPAAMSGGGEPDPWLDPSDDGTIGVHPELTRRYFFQDCDEATTEEALARLTRQSLAPFAQAPSRIGWRERPTTYIVCTEDLATPAEAQRKRVKGDARTVEFEAGHHPFLARPDDFAATPAAELERG
jgi:pimeloyl-ACP methyl ester carboxylesterase